jgi:hypothetical protein
MTATRKLRPAGSVRPKLFIGSSGKAVAHGCMKVLVQALRKALPEIEIVPWTESENWRNLETALASLSQNLKEFTYAIFIFYPDDEIKIDKTSSVLHRYITRDNVLFEFGLFLSSLGKSRTFIIRPKHEGEKFPPGDLELHYLSDLDGSFRAASYTRRPLARSSASHPRYAFECQIDHLVKRVNQQQRLARASTAEDARKELKGKLLQIQSSCNGKSVSEEVLINDFREHLRDIISFKSKAAHKPVTDVVQDLCVFLNEIQDICNTRQLAQEQSYKRGVTDVWVFADVPLEFVEGAANQDLSLLRDTIKANLRHKVKYTYFVSHDFQAASVTRFVRSEKNLAKFIRVIKVEPRLFKTFFTVHFLSDNTMEVFMSAVTHERRDIHIRVSIEHAVRVHSRLNALGGYQESSGHPIVTVHSQAKF